MKTLSSSPALSRFLQGTVWWCACLLLLGAPGAQAGRGVALAIGLNSVDPAHYRDGMGLPWAGKLMGCENDARDMSDIAKKEGFEVRVLLTEAAKRGAVIDVLTKLANELESGDSLVVSFSGHGGKLDDFNGDEEDKQDETWCLFDGQMVDDELGGLWARFREGVRITVYADSCHSGTSVAFLQATYVTLMRKEVPSIRLVSSPEPWLKDLEALTQSIPRGMRRAQQRTRAMPEFTGYATQYANRAFYEQIGNAAPAEAKDSKDKTLARVVLISGCQDAQVAVDGTFNGLFTAKLKLMWRKGLFSGSHTAFHESIKGEMPEDQQPKYFPIGKGNAAFEQQRPWTR